MNLTLHSKKIRLFIHLFFIFSVVWFFFPNLFTHRDIPRWPVFANGTVEGVDRNQNNLRDDVEIRLHRKIGNDEDYLAAIKFAAALQRRLMIKVETRSQGLEVFRNESCNQPSRDFYKRNRLDGFFEAAMFNTQERIDKANENVMFVTGSGDLLEYLCGSTTDYSADYEKYSLRPKNK